MREILFRGKRIDNGEWIEGLLGFDGVNEAYYIFGCEVDPATVGQYTGLTDKNGKWVFEGDVVREVWGECVYDQKFAVSMDSDRCGWFPFACEALGTTCAEVIGNIHDNPELLEEEYT